MKITQWPKAGAVSHHSGWRDDDICLSFRVQISQSKRRFCHLSRESFSSNIETLFSADSENFFRLFDVFQPTKVDKMFGMFLLDLIPHGRCGNGTGGGEGLEDPIGSRKPRKVKRYSRINSSNIRDSSFNTFSSNTSSSTSSMSDTPPTNTLTQNRTRYY